LTEPRELNRMGLNGGDRHTKVSVAAFRRLYSRRLCAANLRKTNSLIPRPFLLTFAPL